MNPRFGRWLRALWTEPVIAALCALALALAQWFPAFLDPTATGFGDWQMIHHNWEAAFIALRRFGEWPLWDPFHCGGVTILGNPESQLYAPLFWLSFAIGTVLATKLFLLLHIAAGLLGMYALARSEYALSRCAAALAAGSWALSGCFAWDGEGGHATFLAFAFAPTLLLCARRLTHSRSYALALAALMSLTLLEGGTYPFPYFVLLLGFALAHALARSRERGLLLRRIVLAAALTALLGAIRLLPIAASLTATPRAIESTDALGLGDVLLMLTTRKHAWRFPPHPYVWPEYGSYVGWPLLLLAAIGLRKSPRHLWVGLGLFLALMLGSRAPYWPWPLLHQLPVYDSLRVPSRFAVLFTLYLSLLGASGFQHVLDWLARTRAASWAGGRALPVIAVACVLGQGLDMLLAGHVVVDRWDGPALSTEAPAARFHLVRDRDYHFQYASYPRRNLGTSSCYVGGMNWEVSRALVSGAGPQARIVRGEGRVLAWGRTTSSAWVEVELNGPGRVAFNQNFAPGWESSTGLVRAHHGLLAAELEHAGRQRVRFRYAPASFAAGALLSLLGSALALGLLWRERRRTARTAQKRA